MRDPLPHSPARTRLTVIGIGNPYRRDDGVGLEVARQLRSQPPAGVTVTECAGEPTDLFSAWEDADAVWIVDAARSGGPQGSVHRLVAAHHALPAGLLGTSTHALGITDAIEISRALGRLPAHVVVYAISGRDFSAGEGLDPTVAAAARHVAGAIRAESANYVTAWESEIDP